MSAVSEQANALSTSASECPICMETIEGLCNRVVTDCGHVFHCSCLMQNVYHNGFECPYCRTKMAEEHEEEEEEEEDENYDSEREYHNIIDDDTFRGFRLFMNNLTGEDHEEEDIDDEDFYIAYGNPPEPEEWQNVWPSADYISQKLTECGITLEDLVKNILFQEHSNYGENYVDYERRSSEVYGQFRAIISQYTPGALLPNPVVANPVVANPVVAEPTTFKATTDEPELNVSIPSDEPPSIAPPVIE